jgi:hypothetical protein
VCHYLLVGPEGGVSAAGEVRAGAEGVCRFQLKPPGSRLIVAAVLEGNAAHAPVRIVPWEFERR